jgi:hypothetical protein
MEQLKSVAKSRKFENTDIAQSYRSQKHPFSQVFDYLPDNDFGQLTINKIQKETMKLTSLRDDVHSFHSSNLQLPCQFSCKGE